MPSHRGTRVPAGIGHPEVRRFLDLKRNRRSNPTGALSLEGLWAIRRAMDAPIPLEVVFVCTSLLRGDDAHRAIEELRAVGARFFEVSERVLGRMVDRDGPDGLAAIARLREHRLRDIGVDDSTRLVIADSFELAGNLGTIIRCADGAGAVGVVVTDRRIRLTHPLVVKASMGTVFSMPVVALERADALAWRRANRVRVIAADPTARVSYRDADYRGPVAIVVTEPAVYGLVRM